MDLLKAEIKRKTPANGPSNGSAPPAKRVQRPGDILPAEQQAASSSQTVDGAALLESAKKVARAEEAAGTTLSKDAFGGDSARAGAGGAGAEDGEMEAAGPAEAFKVSNEEAVRRLRALGQPVRLFGESDKERRLRLRALQLIEERSQDGRNELMRTMQGLEGKFELEELEKRARGATSSTPATLAEGPSKVGKGKDDGDAGKGKKDDEEAMVDLSLVKTEPKKVYPQIYFGLKRVLKEWEKSMAERPDHVRRSTQGKVAAAHQQQSAENLKPLFKTLRKRELEPDVLSSIAEIVHHMQTREYIQANDAYLRLSIGNAPWPIGVTMVGIHERSGREKIFSNNVAHVLNDEVSRKYIQSLKRILTFAQTKWPPSDLSQKMG